MHNIDLTLTGADDSVEPEALARLAADAPEVEWGLLVDGRRSGRPRFPSDAWRREFLRAAPNARRAAHVCGEDQLRELASPTPATAALLGTELRGAERGTVNYHRVQLNFDARSLPLAVLAGLVAAWRNGQWRRADGTALSLITQHNAGNDRVHELFRYPLSPGGNYLPFYSVLFDESGGLGHRPLCWPAPIAGLRCGYAGGISAANIAEVAESVVTLQTFAHAPIWLDVESNLRTCDRFDLGKATELIDAWRHLKSVALRTDRDGDGDGDSDGKEMIAS